MNRWAMLFRPPGWVIRYPQALQKAGRYPQEQIPIRSSLSMAPSRTTTYGDRLVVYNLVRADIVPEPASFKTSCSIRIGVWPWPVLVV